MLDFSGNLKYMAILRWNPGILASCVADKSKKLFLQAKLKILGKKERILMLILEPDEN